MSTSELRGLQRLTIVGCALLLAWQGAALGQETLSAGAMFRQLDKSGDGILTMDEATAGSRSIMQRIFKAAGQEPGGRVTRAEFLTAYESLHAKSASAAAKTPAASPAGEQTARAKSESPPAGIGFIDVDGDDAISRAEWSKFTQTFKSLDEDTDGSLNSAELQATGDSAEILMHLADANGDGKITRTERAKLAQSFARLDANRDKSLDKDELQKAADAAVASANGSASLDGKSQAKAGPTLWRGRIEGRGQIELLVNGNYVVGREIGEGGGGDSLGAGTFTMTGDGKSGNMDAVYTEGDRTGDVCLGIYELNGDKLLWCVNNKGGRPDSLKGGRGNWLLTLTRVEAEPATSTKKTR